MNAFFTADNKNEKKAVATANSNRPAETINRTSMC